TVADLLPVAERRAARASAAFMELGALVCTARGPACADCPLRRMCRWRRAGRPPGTTKRRSQRYAGTDRQVRGLLLAVARDAPGPVTRRALDAVWPDAEQRDRALAALVTD